MSIPRLPDAVTPTYTAEASVPSHQLPGAAMPHFAGDEPGINNVPASRASGPMETHRKINVAFAGTLVLFAIVALTAIIATQRLVSSDQWVSHTHEVLDNARVLDAQLREAKANVRSFVITGDSVYVRRYHTSVDSVRASFEALRRLTGDNTEQQARLSALEPLLADRRASFERTLELREAVAHGPAIGTSTPSLGSQLAIGEDLSNRVGLELAAFDRAESALLNMRLDSQRASEQVMRAVVLAFALVGIALAWVMRRSIRHDFDVRARTERALRESEAKFSGILAIAADAIITIDAQQIIQHFNDGAEQIFGYRKADVIGKRLDLLIPARVAAAHHAHVQDFAEAPDTARRMGERKQVLGRRRNGEEFPADASISKLSTSRGPLFTVVLRDVTEQKRLERHEHLLAESGRKLAGTLEYDQLLQIAADVPVPVLGDWCVLDVVEPRVAQPSIFRRVASRHPVAERDAALRALEAHGLDDDSPSRVLDVMRTAESELIPSVDDEWLEAHADIEELGAVHSLAVRSLLIVPMIGSQGVVGTMTIGCGARRPLDESDLVLARALAGRVALAIENARLYQSARRASAIRDDVLSIVSHDLRNPLAAVSMCARTLLDHPPADEGERRRLYQSSLDAVEWMHRLMQDLLDAASIDAGRLSISTEPQSVAQMIEASIGLFDSRAAAERVTLRMDLEPQVPLVFADSGRVMQVLGNLIGNAIKYTPAEGTITLGAAARGAEVLLWVRDTGAGISAEHLPHVFDRFWHLRGASRTRGSGLGLSIARGIVTAHGGRMWVESVLGSGSTFSFTLPAVIGSGARVPILREATTDNPSPAV